MRAVDKGLIKTKRAAYCPVALAVKPSNGYSTDSSRDRLTFGMAVNFKAGCCADKVKTGRIGGCCAGIPHAKFVEHYRASVQKEIETTGLKPKLDPEVQAVLDGKPIQPKEAVTTVKTKITPVKSKSTTPLEPKWQALYMAPIRFLKWLWVGFWKDLKLLLNGRKED